jgi:hypothetical protein
MSIEDSRAVNIMENSIRFLNGHYEIALPWKNVPPHLPNNRPLAEHRLKLLKKRLVKDPDLFSKYATFMDNLVDKGFAQLVPINSLEQSSFQSEQTR